MPTDLEWVAIVAEVNQVVGRALSGGKNVVPLAEVVREFARRHGGVTPPVAELELHGIEDFFEFAVPGAELIKGPDGQPFLRARDPDPPTETQERPPPRPAPRGPLIDVDSLANELEAVRQRISRRNLVDERLVRWLCYICGRIPKLPGMVITKCKHVYCAECLPDPNAETQFCTVCQKEARIFHTSPTLPDVRSDISQMLEWIYHNAVILTPRCVCNFKGSLLEIARHKCSVRQTATTMSDQTIPTLLLHLTELFLEASVKIRAVLKTRACGRFVVHLPFDPNDLGTADPPMKAKMGWVKKSEVVELLAHPENQLYGWACVRAHDNPLHRWIPTACLKPTSWGRQDLNDTLEALRWRSPEPMSVSELSTKPPLVVEPLITRRLPSTDSWPSESSWGD